MTLVVDAFVDVADSARDNLLGGGLPDRVLGFGNFRNQNRSHVLDIGGAVTAIRPNEVERIVAMRPFRSRREQEDLTTLRFAIAGGAPKNLALEVGDDHRAFM